MQFLIVRFQRFLEQDQQSLIWQKIIRLIIYAGIFFMPLFFIPVFKQTGKVLFLYLLVLLAGLIWFLKIFITKKIIFRWQSLDLPVILFLIVVFLASIFSVDKYHSFLGYQLEYANSWLTLFFLALFYFIVSRFITKNKQIIKSLYLFNLAVLILALYKILQLFLSHYLFSWPLIEINCFNFLLIIALLNTLILFLISSGFSKYFQLILSVIFFLLVLIINNQLALLALALIIFLFIILLSLRSKYFSNRLVVSLTLALFLIVLFLFLPLSNLTGILSPLEFNLPNEFGWQITKNSLSQNLLLGAGPQNFIYSYNKYKPVEINQTGFWELSFTESSNTWLTWLNNLGLLGIILLAVIFVKVFWDLFRFIKILNLNEKINYQNLLISVNCFLILAAIFIWAWLGNLDFTILFVLFFILAISTKFAINKSEKKYLDQKNIIKFIFYLGLVVIVVVCFYGYNFVSAELIFEQTVIQKDQPVGEYDNQLAKIEQAKFKNPYNSFYDLKLISAMLFKATTMISLEEGEVDAVALEALNQNINEEINYLINKNNNFSLNYQLYELLNLFAQPATSLEAYKNIINKKLLESAPNNPELYLNQAKADFDLYNLINLSQLEAEEKATKLEIYKNKILTALDKSLELKPNYTLAAYNLSVFYQEINQREKALEVLAQANKINPADKNIALELKNLYLEQDKVEAAVGLISKYLDLRPADLQLRLELIEIYQLNQQQDLVKKEAEKILELDPENQTALDILKQAD